MDYKRFWQTSLLIGSLFLASCSSPPELSLAHQINVPNEYRSGKSRADDTALAIERYIAMYERGWWDAVAACASDPEYELVESDLWASGGPASIDGYHDGYLDAHQRIRKLERVYGSAVVQEFLAGVLADHGV